MRKFFYLFEENRNWIVESIIRRPVKYFTNVRTLKILVCLKI